MGYMDTPTNRSLPHDVPDRGETICSSCGRVGPTGEFLAVRYSYTTINRPVRTVKSTTVSHLCHSCLEQDEIFTDDAYVTPSKKATRIRQDYIDSL